MVQNFGQTLNDTIDSYKMSNQLSRDEQGNAVLLSRESERDGYLRASETKLGVASTAPLGIDLCRFRSDKDLVKIQKKFVGYFVGAPGPVLDIGCGRGVMLELLTAEGVDCYGVDTFEPAIEACRSKGLRIVDCDLFEHLKEIPDSSLGGLFGSHIVEHLTPALAMILLREALRVLRPGGTLLLITPNSRDLSVVMEGFWLDLTHVRLYPARLLSTLLAQVGFRSVETLEDKDTRNSKVLYKRLGATIRRLWFWGLISRGDVIAVARK